MPASVSVAVEVGAEEVAEEDVGVNVEVGKLDVMDVVVGSIARWNVNCDQDLEETL